MELFPRFATQLLAAVPPGSLFQTQANDGPVWGIRGVDNANVEGAKIILLGAHKSGGPHYGKVSPTLKCIVLLSEYQLALAHDSIPKFSRSFSSGSIYLFGETITIAAKPMNDFDEEEEWFEVATGRTYRPEGSAPACKFDNWSIGIKMSGGHRASISRRTSLFEKRTTSNPLRIKSWVRWRPATLPSC